MESTYVGNEYSNDESDKREMVNNENSNTTRSYDCAFCKRGFTNAQALGGHMNIHRKDKAKAKKLSGSSSSVAHNTCEYFAPITNEQAQFYASLRANNSYQMIGSPPNLNYHHAFTHQGVSNHDLSTSYRDFMDSNLSLRIGLPSMEESREELKKESPEDAKWFENDPVDLELRLGHNP